MTKYLIGQLLEAKEEPQRDIEDNENCEYAPNKF